MSAARSHYETLTALIAAWTAGDIEGALSFMSDDIVWHYAAAIAPPLTGKEKARKFLHRFAAEASDIRWRIFHHASAGNRLFVEGVDEYTSKDGLRIAAPYAGVLEFRDGLICGWRDYLDIGVVEAMKAGGAIPAHIEALIDKPTADWPTAV